MLKLLVPEFRSDLSARLKVIAEKQVPAKVKPISYDGMNEHFYVVRNTLET